jgi:hypothetical protein
MKRTVSVACALVLVLGLWVGGALAYDINGDPGAAIGVPLFSTYGINVSNFTPGTNNGGIGFTIFTNFPQAGETLNGTPPWTIVPADVFITEHYQGVDYQWAVPLVSHDGFAAGTTYAVATVLTSSQLDPSGGTGYIFNPNMPVQIATQGTNYGLSNLGAGTVAWTAGPGNPDYEINVVMGWWEDDPLATLTFNWGTGTCANGLISGQIPSVPIPPSALLFCSGLLGIGLLPLRKKIAA